MTKEQIKQKADDYIITRQNHIKYFSGEAVKILLKNFAEEIVAEETKELREENKKACHKWFKRWGETKRSELGLLMQIEKIEQEKWTLKTNLEESICIEESYKKKVSELEKQIEKLRCCEKCGNYNWQGCIFSSEEQLGCINNKRKLFKLKEIKENG